MQRDTKKFEGFSIFKNIISRTKFESAQKRDVSEFIPMVDCAL
jgi:hypothetical protein